MDQYPIIISVRGKIGTDATYTEFIETLHKVGLFERFEVAEIVDPVYSFRDEIVNHILEHGFSSLFEFSIVMEDITTPDLKVNDIEEIIKKFVCSLAGAKRLIIVDPYLYSERKKPEVVSDRFSKMIGWIGEDLKEIITFTNNSRDSKLNMQSAVTSIRPTVRFDDRLREDLHDRFWIDPDKKRGIVFGTSLNGIGKKLALIDKLSTEDVENILNYLQL